MRDIGLKTLINTLETTTDQFTRSTCLLEKRFKSDKVKLQYKQIPRRYGALYVDYIKLGVKSARKYIWGNLYNKKHGFNKFFLCWNETSFATGDTLRGFIELDVLPSTLCSDNHKNFKEVLFKRLLWKFGIFPTYTEPHSPWQNRAYPAKGEVKRHTRNIMLK